MRAILGQEIAVTQDRGCVVILAVCIMQLLCLCSNIFTECSVFVLIFQRHRMNLSDIEVL